MMNVFKALSLDEIEVAIMATSFLLGYVTPLSTRGSNRAAFSNVGSGFFTHRNRLVFISKC